MEMTEEIKRLFEEKQRAYSVYQMMQHINVFGKTPDETIAMDIAYETANQKWLAAHLKYKNALEIYVKGSSK